MGYHTYNVDHAEALNDPARYRYLSVEQLLNLFDPYGAVADLGSGTGFYTDDIAPYVETLYAVDVQEDMHEHYRQRGAPENVEFVTAEVSDLPFDDASLDGAFSTMTYHEFASEAALDELARVVKPGRLVGVADWTRDGMGEDGPPTSERYALSDAHSAFTNAGFEVEFADTRRETFVLSARRS